MHGKESMLADILMPLSLHYPHAGLTAGKLSVLAEDWCEDLADFSMETVEAAVRNARRRERFFPNVAAVREYAYGVVARRRAEYQDEREYRHGGLPEECCGPDPVECSDAALPDSDSRPQYLLGLWRRMSDGDEEARRTFLAEIRPREPEGVSR